MTVVIRAGRSLARRLARGIWRGAPVAVDPSSAARSVAASAAAVERILARGEPVYGINTGFGKLASVRIATQDLAQLQRNIVLSHAAGVGEPASGRDDAADDGAEARQPRAGRVGRSAADASSSSRPCSRAA